MIKGEYRIFIKVPFCELGIKIPRFNLKVPNSFCCFLTGMIMNILERKRYKRYVTGSKCFDKWYKWDSVKYSLCPTYFSLFGLFNIVRYAPPIEESELTKGLESTRSYFGEFKLDSYGKIGHNIVEIDYGDFTVYYGNALDVKHVDYR